MRTRHLLACIAIAAGLILVAAPALATTITVPKTVPKLVVSPSTGLRNHEWVRVHGTGFKKGDYVYLTECLFVATGANGCDIVIAIPIRISSTGVLPWTRFRVFTGQIGSGRCGTTRTNLHSCALSAGNALGRDTASMRITFVLSPK